MRRTTALPVAGLLGLALLAPTSWAAPATAAGETCRGEAATLVGTGSTITGTEGRDVIVTATAGVVDARGGDDLICVAPTRTNSNVLPIDAGSGDDLVDTTGTPGGYYVSTRLGTGADTLVGGITNDTVYGGDDEDPWVDTERDVIDTGDGGDYVFTGATGTTNHDVVRLGEGRDQVYIASPAVGSDAVLDGGAGEDGLRLDSGATDVELDMTTGTFTSAAGSAAFNGVEFSTITAGAAALTYRGTEGVDSLTVDAEGGAPTLRVVTGAGDDEVALTGAVIAPGSQIDTGTGRDELVVARKTGRLAIDLVLDRLTVEGVDAAAAGVEDAWLMAPEVALAGDAEDNDLTWSGCDATLYGNRGDDSLAWQYDYLFEEYEFRCAGEALIQGDSGNDLLRSSGGDDLLRGGKGTDKIFGRGGDDTILGDNGDDKLDGGDGRDDVRGGKGADRLLGRGSADRLFGGPGRDSADGSQGRDRCGAERERRCER
jgi:Ca2+-binding RTX toxin-like protein